MKINEQDFEDIEKVAIEEFEGDVSISYEKSDNITICEIIEKLEDETVYRYGKAKRTNEPDTDKGKIISLIRAILA